MPPILKRALKRAGHLLGVDVRWHVPLPAHAPATLLSRYRVDTIFDLGANVGMSGEYFRNIGFRGRIVSFEPVDRYYRQLADKARRDPRWTCERAAVGEAEGEREIHVSGEGGAASSFLPTTSHFAEHAPGLREVGRETVRMTTVDAIAERYYPDGDRLFLKLDVQGYEKQALAGARATLPRVVGMKIELSLVRSYQDEPLIGDMLPFLYGLGFRLHGIEEAWSNPATQEVYQVDGFLFRPDRR